MATNVLRVRHRLKMIGPDATPVPTKVVNSESIRDRSEVVLVDPPMGELRLPFAAYTEASIPAGVQRPSPLPALRPHQAQPSKALDCRCGPATTAAPSWPRAAPRDRPRIHRASSAHRAEIAALRIAHGTSRQGSGGDGTTGIGHGTRRRAPVARIGTVSGCSMSHSPALGWTTGCYRRVGRLSWRSAGRARGHLNACAVFVPT